MYLPNKDFLDVFEQMLGVLDIQVMRGSSQFSPVIAFEFEGNHCWVMSINEGYKVYSEKEEAIKSLQKTFKEILKPENIDDVESESN